MAEQRVRIVDIADALGLSTATVSHVIRGKTQKISDETVKRVQEKIAEMNYIPNMAGILLARNNSRIIGVVMNEDPSFWWFYPVPMSAFIRWIRTSEERLM